MRSDKGFIILTHVLPSLGSYIVLHPEPVDGGIALELFVVTIVAFVVVAVPVLWYLGVIEDLKAAYSDRKDPRSTSGTGSRDRRDQNEKNE